MKELTPTLLFGAIADSLSDRNLTIFALCLIGLVAVLILTREKQTAPKPRNQFRKNKDVYK